MTYADAYDPLDGIAITGMAGRFPDSPDVAALWENLLAGRECITRFAAEELETARREDMIARSSPNYVRARGVLEGADEFDEKFFDFTPREAEILDPQHRLFMQAAWEALEHAGYDPQRFDGPIGVFAGATSNTYYVENLLSRSDVTDPLGLMTVQMGNVNDVLATRVSYKFDLTGPSLNIQNACSTSLVAVCTAVQSLQTYQCDMALAGGVSIMLPQRRGYLHEEGSILAPDGHCRAFDRDAAGTVFSNGLGIVVLRRLRDAIEDGDTIYAVIKGAALNNDGNAKVSFTAPSVDGQAQVISMAQMLGGIDPATVSYIEAHGTGTALGDPIEIAGLTQAFRSGGADENGFCAVGSIKSNIGHLDVAAGIAGLIKTTLALHHKILPASIHFESPNPKLGIESTPFFVNATQCDWPEGPTPRRAGVSSLGVGGTNAHVVLEESPTVQPAAPASRPEQLLLLSARDAEALDRITANLSGYLEKDKSADLADIAYTLQVGRRSFGHRRAIVCHDRDDAIALLRKPHPKRVHDHTGNAEAPLVAFMFPGQGAQYVDMGRRLYESEPRFRETIDACARVLQPEIRVDLRTVLYPGDSDRETSQAKLTKTAITQPALFAIEYALAQLWMSWGVQPDAMIGHSIGEFVAACLGGTFTLDDALMLVARRARLMDSMPAGAMLGVRASVELVTAELTPDVVIAAVNAPKHTVVSGTHEAIAAFEARLDTKGVAHRRLHTSHAYHSPMMEPAVQPFAQIVAETPRRTPELRWISSLTGRPITDEEALDPQYWARQLREPVQFAHGVGVLIDANIALIEVGPGQTLATLARQNDHRLPEQLITTSLHPGQDWACDIDYLLSAAGQLWSRNVDIDWYALHGHAHRRRVPLPTYPFKRRRHWVEPIHQDDADLATAAPAHFPTYPAATAAPVMPAQEAVITGTCDRSATVLSRLQKVFADLSGVDPAILVPDATFLEIGFDSLFLTQAASALQKQFGTEITMRTLLDDAPTLNLLVERILPTVPDGALPDTPPVTPAPAVAMPAAISADAGSSVGVALISRQLEMLGLRPAAGAPAIPAVAPIPAAATPAGGRTEPQQHGVVPEPLQGRRMYRPVNRDECIAVLREELNLTAQQRAIVPLEAGGARTPIFAIGGHNGDVFAFRALALYLGPEQPFFGLQPPGLEEGSQPLTRVEDMARHFAEQILTFRPDTPVSIAGFCAGGTIAFELARQLTDLGADVASLILFGAPHYESFRALEWSMTQAHHYVSRSLAHARALRTMPSAERRRYIAEVKGKHLPRDTSDPVTIRRDALERATMAAVRAYSPKPSTNHIDFMIPCESWTRSWAHPLRWIRHATSSTVFVGPDGCNKDTMLYPEHAATFAAFVAQAQQHHALRSTVNGRR